MSYSVYVRIYAFDEAVLPTPFHSESDFWDFVGKHEDEALLSGSSSKGEMYWTLNQCEVRFDLPALADLNIGNPDPEYSQSTTYVKRILPNRLDQVCQDIKAVIDIARTAPESLLFVEYLAVPELKFSMLEDIARATRDDSAESDLSGYQEGEEWFYFFSYLFTVKKICEDAKAENKVVFQQFFEC